jgi:hypothetical protein
MVQNGTKSLMTTMTNAENLLYNLFQLSLLVTEHLFEGKTRITDYHIAWFFLIKRVISGFIDTLLLINP